MCATKFNLYFIFCFFFFFYKSLLSSTGIIKVKLPKLMTRLENFKAFVFNDDDGNSIDLPSVNIISLTGWRHILQHNSYPSPTMKIDCLLWRIYKIANLQAMLLTVLINYLRWRNPLPCLEFFIEAGAF